VTPAALEDAISEEISLALHADAVICVNEQEAGHFRSHLDVPVAVLSHAVQPVPFVATFERRKGFVFVGRLLEESAPNWIGLKWFIREVWPLIRKRMPGATLDVVGYVRADHRELMAGGVRVLGPIEDLSAVLDVARVFVAPVHFAAGIPIKILEAAATGLPVIATPLMAQQLGWSVPGEIRTAATASAFADGAISLHEDAAAWLSQSAGALARVARENSEAAFEARVSDMLSTSRPEHAKVAEASADVLQVEHA
jgi:glycosyltransferase involved in cell wall biosynthesis